VYHPSKRFMRKPASISTTYVHARQPLLDSTRNTFSCDPPTL